MLKRMNDANGLEHDGDEFSEQIDFEALLAIVRRQWRVAVIAIAAAFLIGLAYIATAIPVYTATVSVMIDRGNSQVVEQLSTIGGVLDDEASVLSQVELLKSETIGLAVVDKLRLFDDPTFKAERSSLVGSVKGLLSTIFNVTKWFSDPESDEIVIDRKRRAASNVILDNMTVSRVGKTYVLSISYSSTSPELAQRIANTIASEYLVDKLNSKYDATRRASDWLLQRISELRQKALDTDLAVQKYRAQHGLIQAGNDLVSDQQLSELNSALIVAQADTAKAQARLERIQGILQSGQLDAVVTDILDNSVATDLRKKYLEASKLEADISARLGSRHIQAVRLRNEMDEYKRLMFEELHRVAESYKSDLNVAQAREKSLLESVQKASDVSAVASETQVQLRELQREAETYKNMYQTFLQRYQEAVQQQSFPITEARIISRAQTPSSPSHPKKSLVLALFCVIGAAAGSGVGAFREFRDRFFRTGDQVRDILGVEFLGNVPIVDEDKVRPIEDEANLSPRSFSTTSGIGAFSVMHPLSSFAETMRSTRLAIDLGVPAKKPKIIGLVSVLPGEGKSTIALNLANLIASQGAKTILIDGDIRNPTLTRSIGKHANTGLIDVLMNGKEIRETLLFNPKTGLSFLPAIIKHRVSHSSELLMSVQMQKLLHDLSAAFDYILIDLPPIGAVIDARAMAGRVDGFVFVTEWGQTARRAVRQIFENEHAIRAKCLGLILNKVDQEKLDFYKSYGSSDYYYHRYNNYYRDS